MAQPLRRYVATSHALDRMTRRGISEEQLVAVLGQPEQRYPQTSRREVLQSRFWIDSKLYLVRVFVDTSRDPPEVLTAYRTSRIRKYWRDDESQV